MTPGIIESLGYSWLVLPKTGLLPLSLIKQSSRNIFKSAILGSSKPELLTADIFSLFPMPKGRRASLKIEKPHPVPDFKGYDIIEIKSLFSANVSQGNSFLKKLKAESKINKSGKLLYSFSNVISRQLHTAILLERYLNIHPPMIGIPGFTKSLNKGEIFVITEVLQANKIEIESADDFKIKGKISTKVVTDYISAIQGKTAKRLVMKYSSPDEPITFAIKAVKIKQLKGDNLPNAYSLSTSRLKSVRSIKTVPQKSKKPALQNELDNFIISK